MYLIWFNFAFNLNHNASHNSSFLQSYILNLLAFIMTLAYFLFYFNIYVNKYISYLFISLPNPRNFFLYLIFGGYIIVKIFNYNLSNMGKCNLHI